MYPHDAPPDYSRLSFYMYRIAIFPVLFFFLISINTRIWEQYGINYDSIFEMEGSKSKWSFMLFALSLYVLVFTSLLVYILSVSYNAMGVQGLESSWLHPIVLFAILIVWLILPTENFFGNVRFWILNVLYRCVLAPMYPITFKDLWFADQLTSMGDVLFELQFIMCIYPAHFIEPVRSFCFSTRSIGVPVLNIVPFWIRFWQCVRAYRDSHAKAQLVNAGKYLSSMLPICLAFVDRMTMVEGSQWSSLKVMWLFANIFSTIYKYIWDVHRDWGLFTNLKDTRNMFLRHPLTFEPIWYYVAIVANLFLRLSWLIVLLLRSNIPMGPSAIEYITWSVIFLELLRRSIWNVFRVELEHLNTAKMDRDEVGKVKEEVITGGQEEPITKRVKSERDVQ
jgi:hypothetical protein